MYTCIYKFALQMKYIMIKRVKILILQITLVKLGSHKKKLHSSAIDYLRRHS